MSGGAAAAFLTFFGSALKDTTASAIVAKVGLLPAHGFVHALQAYVLSVVFSMLAYGFTYLAHMCFYFERDRTGIALSGITIVMGFACVIAFAFGSYSAIDALGQIMAAI